MTELLTWQNGCIRSMTDLDPDAIFTQWMKYQGFEPNAHPSLLSCTCTGLMHMRADNKSEKRDLAGDYLRRAREKEHSSGCSF